MASAQRADATLEYGLSNLQASEQVLRRQAERDEFYQAYPHVCTASNTFTGGSLGLRI